MLTLTFDNLFVKIKMDKLPSGYSIKSPATIKFSQFFEAIYSFKTTEELLTFINKMSNTPGIVIKSSKNFYEINSLADFLFTYSQQRFYKDALSKESNFAVLALLQTVTFSKEQLIRLLRRLSPNDIQDLILFNKCFSEDDLLEIVNNVSVLNSFSRNVIGLLYFYYNPKREWKESNTPLLDINYFSYRIGHTLGLTYGIYFKVNGKKFTTETEGEYAATSLTHLTEHLYLYNQAYAIPVFQKIYEAFQFSNNLIIPSRNDYHDSAAKKFYRHYKNDNKLIYISSGWTDHIVGLAFYGDYLIYSNRGDGGDKKTGCRIFKIKDRKLITSNLIAALSISSFASANKFHHALGDIVDFKSPVVSFESKRQKYDTCSYVNPKASIEAMIVLLQVGPLATSEMVKAQFVLEKNRCKYKFFTDFVRNAETDELIKNMFYANNEYLIAFYGELTKEIIYQHHGNNLARNKDISELYRAYKIYENLPVKIKEHVDADTDFLNFIDSLSMNNDKGTSLIFSDLFSSQNVNALSVNDVGNRSVTLKPNLLRFL